MGKYIIKLDDDVYSDIHKGIIRKHIDKVFVAIANSKPYNPSGDAISREALQGEYETACNVLLSLEQIVRSSDGWEDSAVEAVHNAVKTAIKCMHGRPQGEWRDNLIEVFRQSAEVGGDTFHLFEIERIINGEPI